MSGKKIIYHCYGGAHSSVTAAAIHLGKLVPHKKPTKADLLRLTLFDRQTQEGHGQIHYYGQDEWDNEVYSLGCRNVGAPIETMLRDVAALLAVEDEIVFIDTLPCVNIKMRLGGYISRRLGIIALGRPIVLQGTMDAFEHLAQLVEQVKSEVCA